MSDEASNLIANTRNFAANRFPNNKQIADPIYAGFIVWSGFHLALPKDTMSVFAYSDPFATIQYIFTRFAVRALISRAGVRPDRFTYLTTFISQVSADRKSLEPPKFDATQITGNKYSIGKSFVMQVVMLSVEGLSETATVWIEDNCIEIFNPHAHRSAVMTNIVNSYVVPFLREKWMTRDTKPKVYEYFVPAVSCPNSMNTYFIFLRSAQSSADADAARAEVARAFDETISSRQSLEEKRNLLIQTCGLLIARCAELQDESPNKQYYQKLFGPNSTDFALERGRAGGSALDLIPNIFTRCTMPQSELW
jgi:hypothetical protein